MREIKSAVIGCGLISKNHLKALRNVEGARCGAVCDIVREKAEAAAGAYSENGEIQIYEDYHELLRDGDIEVVHICTPHHLHADMAVEALLRGKHVLCEKPMALTADDAKRMIKARDESGKCLGRFYHPPSPGPHAFVRGDYRAGKSPWRPGTGDLGQEAGVLYHISMARTLGHGGRRSADQSGHPHL